MSDTPTLVAVSRHEQLVGDSAVEVTVAFPAMVMSVSAVESWRSGSIIDLGCRLAQARIVVHVGGREIASGRLLVFTEGSAGVELSQVRT